MLLGDTTPLQVAISAWQSLCGEQQVAAAAQAADSTSTGTAAGSHEAGGASPDDAGGPLVSLLTSQMDGAHPHPHPGANVYANERRCLLFALCFSFHRVQK